MDSNTTLTAEGISIAFFAGLGSGLVATGLMVWRATCVVKEKARLSQHQYQNDNNGVVGRTAGSSSSDVQEPPQTYTRVSLLIDMRVVWLKSMQVLVPTACVFRIWQEVVEIGSTWNQFSNTYDYPITTTQVS